MHLPRLSLGISFVSPPQEPMAPEPRQSDSAFEAARKWITNSERTVEAEISEGHPGGKAPSRANAGVELTIGLVRQRSAINIGELESDMETAGKVTARDREVIRLMRKADGNGNGRLDALETIKLVHEAAQVRQPRSSGKVPAASLPCDSVTASML